MTSSIDDKISAIAYQIWEAEGRPEGRDQAHWFLARERVLGTGEARETAATEARDAGDHAYVRPAGRGKMEMPPATWSKTDEEIDESFPASDPPGNY